MFRVFLRLQQIQVERGSGTKGCTKFRSRTSFEKRRLKLPFDFSRTFFVKVATRFAGFVKEHVLKTVSSFYAILYLLLSFLRNQNRFWMKNLRSSSNPNCIIIRVKFFPFSSTRSLCFFLFLPKSRDNFETYLATDFFFFYEFEAWNLCFHQGKIDILLFRLVKFLSLSLRSYESNYLSCSLFEFGWPDFEWLMENGYICKEELVAAKVYAITRVTNCWKF